jgi:hypothetical protein
MSIIQRGKARLPSQELPGIFKLDHNAVIEDSNFIKIHNLIKAMGDFDNGMIREAFRDKLGHFLFCLEVDTN